MAPLRLAERNQELLRTFCPQLYEQASVVATQADWLSASHMRTLMEMCRLDNARNSGPRAKAQAYVESNGKGRMPEE